MSRITHRLWPRRTRSLFWRVAITNGAVFSMAIAGLALSPATVSFPLAPGEAVVLVLVTCAVIGVNFIALRRSFAPLSGMAVQMNTIDPLSPGARVVEGHQYAEVAAITTGFNKMVDRLEVERRESTNRVLRAEEAERASLTRELHDEVGQTLTVLLLQLMHAAREAQPEVRDRLTVAQETARGALQEVRRISQRLRPESLDDLGLPTALVTLADRVAGASGIEVEASIAGDLPEVDQEAALAVFRIAQESLTNVVRHSEGTRAHVAYARSAAGVRLTVLDNGRGFERGAVPSGGIRGMRERALAVGGRLTLVEAGVLGTEVRFELPLSGVPA